MSDKIEAIGFAEAEAKVDRVLRKRPGAQLEVWVEDKLAYRVSDTGELKRRLRDAKPIMTEDVPI